MYVRTAAAALIYVPRPPRGLGAGMELSDTLSRPFELLERLRTDRPEIAEDLAGLKNAVRRALVGAAVHMLDTMDFHHIAEHIAEGHLDPTDVPRLRSCHAILTATPWPDSLKSLASTLRDEVARLEQAIINKKPVDARASSHGVHEVEHELSHTARDWLSR